MYKYAEKKKKKKKRILQPSVATNKNGYVVVRKALLGT